MITRYDNGALSAEMKRRRYDVVASIDGSPFTNYSSAKTFRAKTGLPLHAKVRADHVAYHGGPAIQIGGNLPVLVKNILGHECRIMLVRIR